MDLIKLVRTILDITEPKDEMGLYELTELVKKLASDYVIIKEGDEIKELEIFEHLRHFPILHRQIIYFSMIFKNQYELEQKLQKIERGE